jgi:UDP-N-acetylmuramoyl-L-alanyl-D-glutamate--2,6-diaminopimelate ligase
MNAVAARMPLARLLPDLAAMPAVMVTGLSLDGRTLAAGEAFVALRGQREHGLRFVPQARARGAAVVLWDPGEGVVPEPAPELPLVAVPGLRSRLGGIADRCYGAPSAELSVAGITGTNGKTTCAWLLASAATHLGMRGAYVGTLGAGFPPQLETTGLTTPDVITLHRRLRTLRDAGATHVALEVSSHALEQGRIDGLRLRAAAFCNLSRDHLDFHGTMARYAAAKERLFQLPGLVHAVINTGDPAGARIAAALPAGVALTAVAVERSVPSAPRQVQVTAIMPSATGLSLALRGHFGRRELHSRLVGRFNAENLAVVLGLLLAWDFDVDAALAALSAGAAPPGRMEGFRLQNGTLAIVDYAHTPDALAAALNAARAHARGQLAVVFGCGGDRDAGKRAPMGGLAERLADRVFVTDDNPRGEDPDQIVAMIRSGMRAPERATVLRDRAAAIAAALASAGADDVVLIAGKGHEDYQIVGGEVHPFSDSDCVRRHAGVPA